MGGVAKTSAYTSANYFIIILESEEYSTQQMPNSEAFYVVFNEYKKWKHCYAVTHNTNISH